MRAENLRLTTPRNRGIKGLHGQTLVRESSRARAMKVMEELAQIKQNIQGTVSALNRELSGGRCFSEQDSVCSKDFNAKANKDSVRNGSPAPTF